MYSSLSTGRTCVLKWLPCIHHFLQAGLVYKSDCHVFITFYRQDLCTKMTAMYSSLSTGRTCVQKWLPCIHHFLQAGLVYKSDCHVFITFYRQDLCTKVTAMYLLPSACSICVKEWLPCVQCILFAVFVLQKSSYPTFNAFYVVIVMKPTNQECLVPDIIRPAGKSVTRYKTVSISITKSISSKSASIPVCFLCRL